MREIPILKQIYFVSNTQCLKIKMLITKTFEKFYRKKKKATKPFYFMCIHVCLYITIKALRMSKSYNLLNEVVEVQNMLLNASISNF